MKKISLNAFAKANLSLNITGKSGEMHTLDSVMISLDVFDTVTVSERNDERINVRFVGADIDPVNNTAYKAAEKLRDSLGFGADITVEKGIPVGAGLGGSSADGAAVLRAYDAFYGLSSRGVKMRDVALSVGSDVPFMLTGGTARVKGTGEDMFFMENKLPLFAVGLMSESVSTAAAYEKYDELYNGEYCPSDNDKLCELLMSGEKSATDMFKNALFEAAKAISPTVARNYETLKNLGASACMTGSGGMVIGWFTDIESFSAAASRLRGESGFSVFAPVKTGILHRWIER